jgi:hypothetical protein
MSKLNKLLIMIVSFAFLAACTTIQRNEYGIPIKDWQKLSKQEQQLIKQSYKPMQFDDT